MQFQEKAIFLGQKSLGDELCLKAKNLPKGKEQVMTGLLDRMLV